MIVNNIRTSSLWWILKFFAIALLLSTQISAMAELTLGSSLGGGFRTEAGFWERTGNLIDANNRERQMKKAQDEMAGISTGESKSVFGLIFGLVILGGAGYLAFINLSSLERRKRNIIIGSFIGIVATIGFLGIYQHYEKKWNTENLEIKKIAWEKEKLDAHKKASDNIKNGNESIRPLFAGRDDKLLAGSNNLARMAAKYDPSKNIEPWMLERKYITVQCQNEKTCDLIEDNHPILDKLKQFHIYYCNQAYGSKKKNSDIGKFIVTGIAISYSEEETLNAVVSGLRKANIELSTDKVAHVIEHYGTNAMTLTYNKGLSIFWKKGERNVDMCGNYSLAD